MQRKDKPTIEAIKAYVQKMELDLPAKMRFLSTKLDPADVTACAITELAMPEIEEQSVSAAHGQKFKDGRKPGTGGPIRKAIAKLLAKNSALKNPELWSTLKGKPPRGWQFFDNSAGKYIEGPEMANMNYARFCNVCGDERKKMKANSTG